MHEPPIERHSVPVASDTAAAHRTELVTGDTHGADASATRRLGITGKLAWSGAGFLIGAAFWHFVGFWTFVTHAVLGVPATDAHFASAPVITVASAGQQPSLPPVAAADRPSCIALALHRATGETRPEPCEETAALALPLVSASARQDRAITEPQAAPTILPHSDPMTAKLSQNP